ncbi:MAG: hypothetical protein HKN92_11245 [Chitinophagales bacterium]|nr:hypothetical protein [Chitinophagales bacterium]
MKSYLILILSGILVLSCNKKPNIPTAELKNSDEIREMLILAEDGAVIEIPEGKYEFTRSITIDGVSDITIKGAGMDKTILSFKMQEEGAEGIIANADNIVIEDLAVLDTKGDAIKVIDSDGVTFRNLKIGWTGGSKTDNGAYGLYPVSSKNVLVENCEVFAASDAGIYVGQTTNSVIRNNYVYNNVAGIEVENCTYADVYGNRCEGNAGGILVFDLPELKVKNGRHIRVYDNDIEKNNHKNFAPKGNTAAMIPAGTGLLLMACKDVDVFDNRISNNKSVNTAVVSYLITQKPFDDEEYNPYVSGIYIHNNVYENKMSLPDLSRDMGKLIAFLFKGSAPDIIYDGIVDPSTISDDGEIVPEKKICVQNNENAGFVNIDAPNEFENVSEDPSECDCSLSKLKAVSV